jgi:hypothetical protein
VDRALLKDRRLRLGWFESNTGHRNSRDRTDARSGAVRSCPACPSVDVNPVTILADATRGLMVGGPAAEPVIGSLFWATAITAVFAPLSVRALNRRTRARSRGRVTHRRGQRPEPAACSPGRGERLRQRHAPRGRLVDAPLAPGGARVRCRRGTRGDSVRRQKLACRTSSGGAGVFVHSRPPLLAKVGMVCVGQREQTEQPLG